MIKNNLIFAVIILLANLSFSQCPPNGVGFNSQVQIDYFLEKYPNCTEINGNVYIGGDANSPTYSLNALKNITKIHGDFYMDYNIWMASLSGLESLNLYRW